MRVTPVQPLHMASAIQMHSSTHELPQHNYSLFKIYLALNVGEKRTLWSYIDSTTGRLQVKENVSLLQLI